MSQSVSDSDEFLSAEEDNSTTLPSDCLSEGTLQPNQNGINGRPIITERDYPIDRILMDVPPAGHQGSDVIQASVENIPIESCHITSDVPVPPVLLSNTHNVPFGIDNNPDNTDDIPDNTDDIPDNTGDIPDNTGDIPDNIDDIPDNSGDVPDNIGDIPHIIGDIPDNTGDIPDNTDDVPNKSAPEDEIRSVSDPAELEAVRLEVLTGKETGNSLFRNGDFTSALDSYSSALSLCPRELPAERAVLLSNRAMCSLRLGQDQLALSDWTHSLDADPLYRKARLKRAQLHERLGKLEEALEDFSELLKSDPSCPQAREAVPRLSREVEAQREALKQEAMSKLRDLGDMVLKPFGISTSDFNFVQDPNTGSYSMSFGKQS